MIKNNVIPKEPWRLRDLGYTRIRRPVRVKGEPRSFSWQDLSQDDSFIGGINIRGDFAWVF
jgi:hypothetical protein